MKKMNYRVISALFSFLFALACVTITTFAWFIIGDEATVESLEFGAHGEDDIKIGVKIEDEDIANKFGVSVGDIYYTENGDMTSETLKELGMIKSERFHPVSSAYQSEWLDQGSQTPLLREVPSSGNEDGKEIAYNGYFQFEFYFKGTEDMYLYLDEETTVLPDVEKNTLVASSPEGLEKLNKVAETLRISFYNGSKYRILEPNVIASSNTRLFGRLDIIEADGFYDYDLSDSKEILFGECLDKSKAIYGEPCQDVYEGVTHINSFDAKTFTGIRPLDIEASIENGIGGAIQETETLEEMATRSESNEMALAYLEREVDTRIVVTVWSEGWDLDCTMDVISASFLINLVFSGKYSL